MGVNLIIETLEGVEHPDWDPHINGGHKAFAREVMFTLPVIHHQSGEYPDYEYHHRPADFAAWRAAVVGFVNQGLFEKMIDLLEADDRYWIYISQ
jgi:hypothetical protein